MTSPLKTLLHIGAGTGDDLPDHLAQGYDALVLIEPHPRLRDRLEARSKEASRITIIPMAITDRDGMATLHMLNFQELSALALPDGLEALVPGIRAQGEVSVETRSLDSLLAEHARDHITLIIDTPGSEAVLARALANSAHISRLTRLELRAPVTPCYAGGLPASEIVEALSAAGLNLVDQDDSTDPDWPSYTFRPTPTVPQATVPPKAKDTPAPANRLAADLEDLQAKYSALMAVKQEQDALLDALAQALQHSAEALDALSQD